MAASTEDWMCVELAKLGIDANEESARYILAIETAKDLEEYMLDLLDASDSKVRRFVKELLNRWRPPSSLQVPDNVLVYRKGKDSDEFTQGSQKTKKKKQKQENKNNSNSSPENINGVIDHNQMPVPSIVESSRVHADTVKKKSKFVPLYSQEGQEKTVLKLPGRHTCECQAAKHSLVNNCTGCGRVVCQQEGSGPCVFCGTLVCTREELEVLNRGSKKSEKLRQQLMKGATIVPFLETEGGGGGMLPMAAVKMNDGLEKAIKHKEKLLDYDRTSVRRTKVIDDESDYFASDSKWLSKKDREALKKREAELRSQRFASRKDRKITLDFAGRQVIDVESDTGKYMYDANDEVVQQVYQGARPKHSPSPYTLQESGNILNPTIVQPAPTFVSKQSSFSRKVIGQSSSGDVDPHAKSARIQDRELLEMTDEGMCMSMHQPWASLLIKGIKIHEGRTWYTAHRGRLWIAATSKSPNTQETHEVEQMYQYLYTDPNISFPSNYPVGCLLGCVDVVDCLSQEEYRQQFPDGESASPYVFICENPQELIVKFPIKGKHKIYKLDSRIHQAAKKGLRQSSQSNH
ncbi:activating signal cointegrator 1-like [Haliotis cracherodii]|uniref:activating signal cointegrator 1-like n=1 Tax=Haliotis cracherodii TaxID=6455 RepID=UPI0039EA20E0